MTDRRSSISSSVKARSASASTYTGLRRSALATSSRSTVADVAPPGSPTSTSNVAASPTRAPRFIAARYPDTHPIARPLGVFTDRGARRTRGDVGLGVAGNVAHRAGAACRRSVHDDTRRQRSWSRRPARGGDDRTWRTTEELFGGFPTICTERLTSSRPPTWRTARSRRQHDRVAGLASHPGPGPPRVRPARASAGVDQWPVAGALRAAERS